MLVHQADELVAAPGVVASEGVAALVEQRGEAAGSVLDSRQDMVGGAVDILDQALMRADDGRAQALGVGEHGVALGAEIVDKAADLGLVVGIGALQRAHLVVDDILQLCGTRQSAFDAFAEGGDLAAHGLADAHDALGGDGFRLGQSQGDFRHGPAHQAHVGRPADHHGEGHDQQHRNDQHGGHDRQFRLAERVGNAIRQGRDVRAVEIVADIADDADPGGRDGGTDPDRQHRRATAEEGVGHHRGAALLVIGCGLGIGAGRFARLGPALGGFGARRGLRGRTFARRSGGRAWLRRRRCLLARHVGGRLAGRARCGRRCLAGRRGRAAPGRRAGRMRLVLGRGARSLLLGRRVERDEIGQRGAAHTRRGPGLGALGPQLARGLADLPFEIIEGELDIGAVGGGGLVELSRSDCRAIVGTGLEILTQGFLDLVDRIV